ncbi:MAG TPA: DEAD/DEAH box helicase family protein [Planctomycetota bacterium]|nr:DEAD/DEAH box helicase family protein [Planctomycetota bacterium]
MSVTLKAFQRQVLTRLRRFCDRLSAGIDPASAFAEYGGTYRSPPLIDAACVCLAIPTGGGKTLLAAAAAGIVAGHALHRMPALVVWLVPSTAIAEQTLHHLRDPAHMVALGSSAGIDGFGGLGPVRVVDVAQALRLPPSAYHSASVILVATIQQFRIGDPQGRQVYALSDALGDDGAHTLAEVIAQRRPVVIVDEAHNARTPLSFETLARLAPGFVLELTATPARQPWPSNVLSRIDAAALKAEHLLKLPLVLATDPAPDRCLADAVQRRSDLASLAAMETDGPALRPLLLIQAEARRHSGAMTPDVVREHLISTCGLLADAIAIATGDERGLDGIDLDDPACLITTIITVEALREGWDCPAAAVLCTLRGSFTNTAAVQLVGRILRQPGARLRAHDALNRSYAYAVAPEFDLALAALRGCLTDGLGFSAQETLHLVQPASKTTATWQVEPSLPFLIPRLLVRDPVRPAVWEVFRDTHRLANDWELTADAARLSPGEYQPGAAGPGIAEVDLDEDGIWNAESLTVPEHAPTVATQRSLAAWLERRLWADDIRPDDLTTWVAIALAHLLDQRGLPLNEIDHDRWHLAAVLRERLDHLRENAARLATDRLLAQVKASAPAEHFRFTAYVADGSTTHDFRRHAYPLVTTFDSDEERRAAEALDRHPRVARWVRNPAGDHGFALPRRPLAGNRWFHPDLIAELTDGRLLLVEVKGAHLAATVDTQDKIDCTTIWAQATGNGFVLVVGGDVAAISEALG